MDDRVFFVATLQGWTKHNKHARCTDGCVLFVTTLQGWLYETQQRDACEQSDAFFVTILQGWLYNLGAQTLQDDYVMR